MSKISSSGLNTRFPPGMTPVYAANSQEVMAAMLSLGRLKVQITWCDLSGYHYPPDLNDDEQEVWDGEKRSAATLAKMTEASIKVNEQMEALAVGAKEAAKQIGVLGQTLNRTPYTDQVRAEINRRMRDQTITSWVWDPSADQIRQHGPT